MAEEWRVEVDLEDQQHGLTLSERLRSLDLDDEARERLGDRVVVSGDGPRMFLYAATEQQAQEAERVAGDLAAAEGLSAETGATLLASGRGGVEGPLRAASETDEEQAAEEGRHEIAEERAGRHEWEVRVDLPSLRETLELARRLEDEALEVHRRWRHLLVGAATKNRRRSSPTAFAHRRPRRRRCRSSTRRAGRTPCSSTSRRTSPASPATSGCRSDQTCAAAGRASTSVSSGSGGTAAIRSARRCCHRTRAIAITVSAKSIVASTLTCTGTPLRCAAKT